MNVLLTCAGRRNYLVHAFREAVGPRGRVFAADARADASALGEADAGFVLPVVTDRTYVDRLLALCRAHAVDLLVPLNDHELPLLAQHRARFLAVGTQVVISAPSVIEMCADKWATYRFLRAHGIPTAPTFCALDDALAALARGEISFPLVLKPRWGSGSVGIEHVHEPDELALAHALALHRAARGQGMGDRKQEASSPVAGDRRPATAGAESGILIQEQLGGVEHGLDIINDLAGRYVTVFAKRKTMMRSGETDRATVVDGDAFAPLAAALSAAVGHIGNLDCDCFLAEDGTIAVLELNPRFGGGYPFAHVAGANLPAALVAWARGATPDPAWLRVAPGATMAKCDRVVTVPGAARAVSHRDEARGAALPADCPRPLRSAPRPLSEVTAMPTSDSRSPFRP